MVEVEWFAMDNAASWSESKVAAVDADWKFRWNPEDVMVADDSQATFRGSVALAPRSAGLGRDREYTDPHHGRRSTIRLVTG